MFTGIIETIADVISSKRVGGDVRLVLNAPDFHDKEINIGDSVACEGVCLTVVAKESNDLSFDVSIESINHSLLGDWQAGSKINLELALLPTTRLGGHLVSGHVDGLARLLQLSSDARSTRMVFKLPDELRKYVAKKGSITINGVSLTVNAVEANQFSVNIIPHTLKVTTLGELTEGDKVHIEVDQIARYLERLISGDSSADSSEESNLSQSFLADHGFA